jgi:hypothetical protein
VIPKGLQVAAGLIAAAAALLYVTGGVVIALRLLFADFPGVALVGQLPREFLFSVAASEVVGPAIVFGAAIGVLETTQTDDDRFTYGHQPWEEAKRRPSMRSAYVAFFAAAPIALIAPGVVFALARDGDIDGRTPFIVAVVVVGCAALAIWGLLAWKSDGKEAPRTTTETSHAKDRAALVVSGPVLAGGLGLLLWCETGSPRYLGVLAAWFVSLLVVLLAVWLRSEAGAHFRTGGPEAEQKQRVVGAAVLSWSAIALVLVPAFLAVAAARTLPDATVCTTPADGVKYHADGVFVGDTKDRVYIGVEREGRVISIPSANVARVVIGDEAHAQARCPG